MSAVRKPLPRLEHPRPHELRMFAGRRRADWRERLIDAERGYRIGLRTASTLFVHLFASVIVLVTGVVLGFSIIEWLLMLSGVGAVIASELFVAALRVLAEATPPSHAAAAQRALQLGVAAALTVTIAAGLVTAIITIGHLWELFG